MRAIAFACCSALLAFAASGTARAGCPDVAGYVHDSFLGPDAAWTKGAVTTGGGTLTFPLKADTVAFAVNHVEYLTGDATVCAVVTLDPNLAKEEEAGLAFWMDYSGKAPAFYTFTVSPSGFVAVSDRDASGRYRTLLRKKSAALQAGAGAANELRAIARGGSVRLTINGRPFGTIAAKAPAAWYPGLFAISPDKRPAAWKFTSFSVSP